MNLLRKFKIRLGIKFNKIKHKKYYEEFEKSDKLLLIKKKYDLQFLYLVPKMKGIVIEVEKNRLNSVKDIKVIASIFSNKEIHINENVKILSNKDIKDLYYINKKIYLNNKYIEKRNYMFSNEIYKCDINTYVLIIDKIEFLINICKQNFEKEEEQIIFIISQIIKYIKYVDYHDYRTCLANSILLGTGVCVDFAITLYKCITDLGYECELINGIGFGNKEDLNSDVNITKRSDHSWNQIKLDSVWYNIDITWLLTLNDFNWVLVSDEVFEKDYKHITNKKEHYCKNSFDREKLRKLWVKINRYESVLKEFDKGNKNY